MIAPGGAGMQDIAELIFDMFNGPGGMSKRFSFMPAPDPFEYDSLAFQKAQNEKDLFGAYAYYMAGNSARRNIASLASAFGLGDNMAMAMQKVMKASGGRGLSMVGQHGGEEAVRRLLSSANGIAYATGNSFASIVDPNMLAMNASRAAYLGAAAYNNNFNESGAVDLGHTHGVSLPAAAMISGRALSERSLYTSWAAEERRKVASGVSGSLRIEEIQKLEDGTGMTSGAVKSLNSKLKKFTEGLNGLVASVARLTGSYDEAINLIQQSTGGQMFSHSGSADAARARVARSAAAMRVSAADAGISPALMYNLSKDFSSRGAMAAGLSEAAISLGGASSFSGLGNLASTMYAKWLANNRGATDRERYQAAEAIAGSVSTYTGSGQDRLNAYAAYLKDSGRMSNDVEARFLSALESGNAEQSRRVLEEVAGADAMNAFVHSEGRVHMARIQNSASYSRYAQLAVAVGRNAESGILGREKRFEEAMSMLAGAVSEGGGASRSEVMLSLDESYGSALMSDEAMAAAGITDKNMIAAFRERNKGKRSYLVMEDLVRIGGDRDAAGAAARQIVAKNAGRTLSKYTASTDESEMLRQVLASEDFSSTLKAAFADKAPKNILDVRNLIRDYSSHRNADLAALDKITGGRVGMAEYGTAALAFSREVEAIDPVLTENDLRAGRVSMAQKAMDSELASIRTKAMGGDASARKEYLDFYDKDTLIHKASMGIGYSIRDDEFAKSWMSRLIGVYKSDNEHGRATRLVEYAHAEYAKARREGKSEVDAAIIARQATFDYVSKSEDPADQAAAKHMAEMKPMSPADVMVERQNAMEAAFFATSAGAAAGFVENMVNQSVSKLVPEDQRAMGLGGDSKFKFGLAARNAMVNAMINLSKTPEGRQLSMEDLAVRSLATLVKSESEQMIGPSGLPENKALHNLLMGSTGFMSGQTAEDKEKLNTVRAEVVRRAIDWGYRNIVATRSGATNALDSGKLQVDEFDARREALALKRAADRQGSAINAAAAAVESGADAVHAQNSEFGYGFDWAAPLGLLYGPKAEFAEKSVEFADRKSTEANAATPNLNPKADFDALLKRKMGDDVISDIKSLEGGIRGVTGSAADYDALIYNLSTGKLKESDFMSSVGHFGVSVESSLKTMEGKGFSFVDVVGMLAMRQKAAEGGNDPDAVTRGSLIGRMENESKNDVESISDTIAEYLQQILLVLQTLVPMG